MPVTNQSKVINASIDAVWEKFSNFHDLSWASGVVPSCENTGDINGTKVGAKRLLNGVFHETLTELNADTYSLKYSIDDGPSPVSKQEVSNYIGSIQLRAAEGGGTLVEWDSSWQSNSEDAVDFCHGIYVALLNELETTFS
jgi:hypothetical protein